MLASTTLDPRFYAGWKEEHHRANISIGGEREKLVLLVVIRMIELYESMLVLIFCTAGARK